MGALSGPSQQSTGREEEERERGGRGKEEEERERG